MQELYKYLGSFGLYHILLFCLNAVADILCACQLLAFTWTGFAPNVRCRLPLDGNETNYEKPFDLEQIDYWYPKVKGKEQFCRYCPSGPSNGSLCIADNSISCNKGHIFDPNGLIPNSLTVQLDMACENVWERQLIFSLTTVGFIIGLAVMSPLSDRYGRRPIFLANTVALIICVFVAPLANNYYAYAVLQVAIGTFNTGVFTTGYVAFVEMADSTARTLGGIWLSGVFPIGLLYLCLVAALHPNWQFIQLYVALPSLLLIPAFWFFPESIRWLLVKDRTQEAENVIRQAAKTNKVVIPDGVIRRFIQATRANLILEAKNKGSTVLDLFTHFLLAKNTLIIFYYWFASSMAYYGLAQNTQDLPGNAYMTFALSAALEIPGYALCFPMMNYWGRRPTLVTLMSIGGLCTLLAGVVPSDKAVLAMALLGKMCVAAGFACIYNYSAELFPTVCRQSALSCGSICARIGSILAPQIRLLGNYVVDWLPVVIYGVAGLLAGLLAVFLPETRKWQMPESIADSIRISSTNLEELEKEAVKDENASNGVKYGSIGNDLSS